MALSQQDTVTLISNGTINAGSTLADSIGVDLSSAAYWTVGIKFTPNGSATDGIYVECCVDSTGGSTQNFTMTTHQRFEFRQKIPLTNPGTNSSEVGVEIPATVSFPVNGIKYAHIRLRNADSSHSVTAVNVYSMIKTG